jgi:catechol 2,3-dioxygenase-like lactoylglutathione lyase family enzyme
MRNQRIRRPMPRTGSPQLYRVLVPAKNLNQSRRFYESLMSAPGRKVGGGRVYFDCGPVILGVLDYSSRETSRFTPPAEALYFATNDLERVYRRARQLGCLTTGLLHDDPSSPLGEIVVRPWGERSFYAVDPSGNPLCFVDSRTLFTGTRAQIATLRRSSVARSRSTSPRRRSPRRT